MSYQIYRLISIVLAGAATLLFYRGALVFFIAKNNFNDNKHNYKALAFIFPFIMLATRSYYILTNFIIHAAYIRINTHTLLVFSILIYLSFLLSLTYAFSGKALHKFIYTFGWILAFELSHLLVSEVMELIFKLHAEEFIMGSMEYLLVRILNLILLFITILVIEVFLLKKQENKLDDTLKKILVTILVINVIWIFTALIFKLRKTYLVREKKSWTWYEIY